MQLMPGTAQLVAKKIGLGPISREQMNDINTNILLGTNYLSMIYNQFDDSAVLATAGYNAGRAARSKWRATLQRPVEGAIFAETIPFNETRDYVKNVLVQHGLLRGIVRRPSAIAEGAAGLYRAVSAVPPPRRFDAAVRHASRCHGFHQGVEKCDIKPLRSSAVPVLSAAISSTRLSNSAKTCASPPGGATTPASHPAAHRRDRSRRVRSGAACAFRRRQPMR